jgi:pilus assembly protein Flp/PilA
MAAVIMSLIVKDDGATSVEYAIMASLIAGVIVAAVALLGTNTLSLFQSFADKYPK